MGKNLNQITNQATSFEGTDKFYLIRSPYETGPTSTDDKFYYWDTLLAALGSSFVTVGATGGAQYAEYSDAWADGKRFTYQISNTTETKQFTFPDSRNLVVMFGKQGVTADFANFNVLTAADASINFFAKGISLVGAAPTTAFFYVGSGSQIRMSDGLFSLSTSVNNFSINGSATFIPSVDMQNMQLTVTGTTNAWSAALMNFRMVGGSLTYLGTAGTTFVNASSGTVLFAPNTISGKPAAGTIINANVLNVANVLNQTNAASGPILYIANTLNFNNYFDYNFNSAKTNFQVNANGNGSLINTKILGGFDLKSNSFINIMGSVLDSYTDGSGSGDATVYAVSTQFIASGGSFDIPNAGGGGTKSYSFINCSAASDTTVHNNGTFLNTFTVNGDFTIANNVSNVFVNQITAQDYFIGGNYCQINGFTGNNATLNNNAIGSGLLNSTLLGGGITVTSGCTDCTVLNTKATVLLVDNGSNTQKDFNLP